MLSLEKTGVETRKYIGPKAGKNRRSVWLQHSGQESKPGLDGAGPCKKPRKDCGFYSIYK